MLKLTVIGHLGQDAVLKTFGSANFISFSVAHTGKYKDSQGVEHEKTQWVSCLRRVGENSSLIAYLKKGTKVYVEGRLTARLFESQASNSPQIALNLDVSCLELLSVKSEPSQPQSGSDAFGEPRRVSMVEPTLDNDNGLPF